MFECWVIVSHTAHRNAFVSHSQDFAAALAPVSVDIVPVDKEDQTAAETQAQDEESPPTIASQLAINVSQALILASWALVSLRILSPEDELGSLLHDIHLLRLVHHAWGHLLSGLHHHLLSGLIHHLLSRLIHHLLSRLHHHLLSGLHHGLLTVIHHHWLAGLALIRSNWRSQKRLSKATSRDFRIIHQGLAFRILIRHL